MSHETRIANYTNESLWENFRHAFWIQEKGSLFREFYRRARFANVLRGGVYLHLDEIPYFRVQPSSLEPSE